jgi:hypothetical protein
MARDWKFRNIGDCGAVELRFDLTGVTGFNSGDLRLVVDLDGDGSYDDETPLTGVYAAPFFTVSGVTLPNNAKVTLCSAKTNYYAVTSGVSSDMIWSSTPDGNPEFALTNTCPSIDLTVNAGVTLQVNGVLTCRNLTVEGTLNLGDDQSDNLIVHGDIHWGNIGFKSDPDLSFDPAVLESFELSLIDFGTSKFFPLEMGKADLVKRGIFGDLAAPLLSPFQLQGYRIGRRDDVYRLFESFTNLLFDEGNDLTSLYSKYQSDTTIDVIFFRKM